jgi:uncharacterized protein YqhQ
MNVIRSIIEGCIKIGLFVLYVWAVSFMPDIRRTFQYHGAEHKTIFCYEAGLELTVENVRKMRRFHPRCGTSFLILMLLVSIVVGFFIPPTLPTLLRSAIKLALIPVIMGIGYELIRFAGKHDNAFINLLSRPGMWLQGLTTREPDRDMIEVAIRSVEAVFDWKAFVEEERQEKKKKRAKKAKSKKTEKPIEPETVAEPIAEEIAVAEEPVAERPAKPVSPMVGTTNIPTFNGRFNSKIEDKTYQLPSFMRKADS